MCKDDTHKLRKGYIEGTKAKVVCVYSGITRYNSGGQSGIFRRKIILYI